MRQCHCRRALLLALCVVFMAGERVWAENVTGPVLPIEDVRPGMRGVAWTVFEGDEARSFDVELLGVAEASRPKGRLILFRALGDTLAHMGIVAGMSGSPVYVDGKLVGAISIGFAFAKDAVGMITPIGEMLDVMDRVDQPTGPWMGPTTEAFQPILQSFLARTPALDAWTSPVLAGAASSEGLKLTTLCGSGWAPGMESTLSAFAGQCGMASPMGAWAGGSGEHASKELTAGSAMGVLLISGDASLGAIGTVTCRQGNRIVAFGHPLFQAGPVELPLTASWIHTIVASVNSSFNSGVRDRSLARSAKT